MYFRLAVLSLFALFLVSVEGCKKSAPSQAVVPASGELVARIHWLGKKRISLETNATFFVGIWNLPESARLESQTLDKLATAPWRLLLKNSDTNVPSQLLRPLLDDLVQQECYLEIRQATNEPAQLVFAVRAGKSRATLWEKNLGAVLESLTGLKTVPKAAGGWSLTKHDAPGLIELSQAGDWTIVGLAQSRNELMDNILKRVQQAAPFVTATNYWLEFDIDPSRTSEAVSARWKGDPSLSRLTFNMIGDGENVRTRGTLGLPKPSSWVATPWNIPTNLINEPLESFTAVRGVKHLLEESSGWNRLHIGPPPDQIWVWSVQGVPYQTYFAALIPQASNYVTRLADQLSQRTNVWPGSNAMGRIRPLTNGTGVAWIGVPFMAPFLKAHTSSSGEYVCGGCFPFGATNRPPPSELLGEVISPAQLVYYDWELTGARIGGWFDIGQLLRIAFLKPQIPPASASVKWLSGIAPRLGNCTTEVLQTSPTQFSLGRKSTIGLTAGELHLVADWLESPEFPRGFHTLEATNNSRYVRMPEGANR